jgi:cytochrome o ubiquinol oxidase operon protein cyoD
MTKNEHGSSNSYIIGFALSLVLTIIPYYLVTRQVVSGTPLLLVILGIAIVQMFIQIFFFLHLGRGPKPLYNVVFFAGTAGLIVMVIGASLLIMDNLYRTMSPDEVTMRLAQDENIAEIDGQPTGACQGNKANHIVTISNTAVTPQYTDAKRCDTITFKSDDGMNYMLMFGSHETPSSYGGLDDVSLRGSRSEILTLNETGDFSFHDHMDPSLVGHFSVQP